jgi:carboxyl-terminal processing protease
MSDNPELSIAEYLVSVLDFIERNAYYLSRIGDWHSLRLRVISESAGAKSTSDLYPIIDEVLGQLGDDHSSFWRPKPPTQATAATSETKAPIPYASLLDGRWGYLYIPDCYGDDAVLQAYTDTGRTALNQFRHAQGWIIDLRKNTGGNMFPMLTTIGPIAGTGILGKFVYRSGEGDSWGYRSGATFYNDHEVLKSQVVVEDISSDIPVALLLGNRTGSSGEITAIGLFGRPNTRSFGQPTRGVPTANNDYDLPDGAKLLVTTALTADRSGKLYDSRIVPDEITKNDEAVPPVCLNWLAS